MELANLWKEIFFKFYKHVRYMTKRCRGVCNERDFLRPLSCHVAHAARHACSSYRREKMHHKERQKKKRERVDGRHLRQAAWNRLVFLSPCIIGHWQCRSLGTALMHPSIFAYILSRHSYAPRVANVGYCSAPWFTRGRERAADMTLICNAITGHSVL